LVRKSNIAVGPGFELDLALVGIQIEAEVALVLIGCRDPTRPQRPNLLFRLSPRDILTRRIAGVKQYPHRVTRSQAMQDTAFKSAFDIAQNYLRSLKCATIAIDNPLELYLFEAFCAMELDTSVWNTFMTH